MRRKLLAGTLAFMAGLLALEYAKVLTILAVPVFYCLQRTLLTEEQRQTARILLLLFCLGTARMGYDHLCDEHGAELREAPGHYVVQVKQVRQKDDKWQLDGVIRLASGRTVPSRWFQGIRIVCDQPVPDPFCLPGSLVEVSGELILAADAGDPGCFDYRRYLQSKGIRHLCYVHSLRVTGPASAWIWKMVQKLLSEREHFLSCLPCRNTIRGVIRGILFGDTSQMDEDLYQDFRNNGTAHVLAVSGLHVGILYGIYRRATKKRKSAFARVLLVAFLLLYGTLTLWSVSVTRAILLILLLLFGQEHDRCYDLMTALSAVAAVLLLKEPGALFGASFQMSFLAVTSIAFFTAPLKRVMPEALAQITAVQLGMLPYMVYVFHTVPLLAFLCNPPVLFLLSALVPAGMVTLILFIILNSPGMSGVILCRLTELLVLVNHEASFSGGFSPDIPAPPLGILVFLHLFSLFLVSESAQILFHRKQSRQVILCITGIAVISLLAQTTVTTGIIGAPVVMVDVGQGDCMHFRTEGHTDILIDGGGKEEYNIGEKILKPYLLHSGAWDLDLGLVTHQHTDHLKGLEELKESFRVRDLITHGHAGQEYDLPGKDRIEILWPLKQDPSAVDENENSLVLKVQVRGITTLVTGDLTSEGEKGILQRYQGTDILKCDVLKVCHHGSEFSSTDEFIAAVDPKVAVIGVGRNNYGHPSPLVIEKMEKKGIIVFRTDRDGAIAIRKKRGNLQVWCQRKSRKQDSRSLRGI